MPIAQRGGIYLYDFGPTIGNELSGRRPALIVSNTELNRRVSIAIAIPMTTTPPSARHYQNHVFITDSRSWASVRQIKAIEQQRLGRKIAEASAAELEKALEVLVARLASGRTNQGRLPMESGDEIVDLGTIWSIESVCNEGSSPPIEMLVLDYNNGNQLAIAVEVERGQARSSPVRIPIEIRGGSQMASALIHRVRSVDVSARALEKTGEASGEGMEAVGRGFLSLISH